MFPMIKMKNDFRFTKYTLGAINHDVCGLPSCDIALKFISKSLWKCLHLEGSSDLLFRRFNFWCVVISNFSLKQRLHLSIAQFAGAYLCTIFQAISLLLFVDLRFHTSFESSVLFYVLFVVKWFFVIGELFLKNGFITTLVVLFVIINFVCVQTDLINVFCLTFCV